MNVATASTAFGMDPVHLFEDQLPLPPVQVCAFASPAETSTAAPTAISAVVPSSACRIPADDFKTLPPNIANFTYRPQKLPFIVEPRLESLPCLA
ncbi:hypothetical protein JQ557_30585 [Bradyrhizobium sp. U87765 SZCCT0131]|uniref:hypothetical protein n=1 Tax=unclassified Bradyrhizobium TaxID=2631580 RepID=UPI001BA64ED4|nr:MULTISPECIES: hypothetical protein [unclassified Bradyrhizobium]MBR1222383.1 hypothetical protein [Bradyrhizobium sp. U87765 SZCCT0131]MBR1264133.1 hypothetical protein [Bradyrhizobium sp. U87765 SZCCT0134]MBR1308084.1 hypothetical protein [Bradyrhizobium sp. U87765 SZCCT0110]MBR1320383.1 hypothetical protein [Bradyrhizobium sp. U87765 SZCCT0109]MBR1348504.1 hypothetical protein [Bradyrhizobium sp. U87765 SZCCT0048]